MQLAWHLNDSIHAWARKSGKLLRNENQPSTWTPGQLPGHTRVYPALPAMKHERQMHSPLPPQQPTHCPHCHDYPPRRHHHVWSLIHWWSVCACVGDVHMWVCCSLEMVSRWARRTVPGRSQSVHTTLSFPVHNATTPARPRSNIPAQNISTKQAPCFNPGSLAPLERTRPKRAVAQLLHAHEDAVHRARMLRPSRSPHAIVRTAARPHGRLQQQILRKMLGCRCATGHGWIRQSHMHRRRWGWRRQRRQHGRQPARSGRGRAVRRRMPAARRRHTTHPVRRRVMGAAECWRQQ
mmetsp:Transcript_14779/g.43409  ORF Transcript_14779/g.43409 Transcript_14779/m.43409 type:complete len:294 (+) Transcript_14779:1562-2443(+)